MDLLSVGKTSTYTLHPTPEQERAMAVVLRRCRALSNAGLQERRAAWQQSSVSSTAASQRAHLPAIKEVRPDDRAIHAQVVQDVRTRLERACHACFRRVHVGETPGSPHVGETPGSPRVQGPNRSTSFTSTQVGNGATLDGGSLVHSKMGRLAVRWSRPTPGTPKTVTSAKEADGWYACFSCVEVRVPPLPRTGRETGIDGGRWGRRALLGTAGGEVGEHPRLYRRGEKQLQKVHPRVCRRKKGSQRCRTAVALLANASQHVQRQRRAFHHQAALVLVLVLVLVRAYDTIDVEASHRGESTRRVTQRT